MKWEDEGDRLVTPGVYTVKATDAEYGTTKKGDPCMNVTLEIQGSEFGGVTVRKTCVKWIVCKLAKALGFSRKETSDGKGYYELDAPDLIGKVFSVDIGSRVYNGKTYNDIGNDFAPVGDPVPAGAAEDDIPF